MRCTSEDETLPSSQQSPRGTRVPREAGARLSGPIRAGERPQYQRRGARPSTCSLAPFAAATRLGDVRQRRQEPNKRGQETRTTRRRRFPLGFPRPVVASAARTEKVAAELTLASRPTAGSKSNGPHSRRSWRCSDANPIMVTRFADSNVQNILTAGRIFWNFSLSAGHDWRIRVRRSGCHHLCPVRATARPI